jgi:hypothetical protein
MNDGADLICFGSFPFNMVTGTVELNPQYCPEKPKRIAFAQSRYFFPGNSRLLA